MSLLSDAARSCLSFPNSLPTSSSLRPTLGAVLNICDWAREDDLVDNHRVIRMDRAEVLSVSRRGAFCIRYIGC